MDREKQMLLVLRGLFVVSGLVYIGPLAYEVGEWDDRSVVTRVCLVFHVSCPWILILAYRGLRNGGAMAFTLRKDSGQLLRNLSGASKRRN
jgi:hypothetical protein